MVNEVQNVDERKKKLKMNKIKKGIYLIHFENDDKNIYKIGSTTNLTKRLKQFRTSHIGNIDVVRFYDMDENILKGEEILQWRLRKNRVKYNQEFFIIENLQEIDLIVNEIIQIINDGLYPSEKSTEEQLRLFVIRILGGIKEDEEYHEYDYHENSSPDKHKRFDFYVTHSDDFSDTIKYNNEIINILKEWKLLVKSTKFSFEVWKGSGSFWFSLNYSYRLNNKFNEIMNILEYSPKHWHYCSNILYWVNDDEYYDYGVTDSGGYGTISIIVNIIKLITLSKYYWVKD